LAVREFLTNSLVFISFTKVCVWHIPEEAHWSAHEPVNGPSFDQLFVAP
jgi:hypothetical protein